MAVLTAFSAFPATRRFDRQVVHLDKLRIHHAKSSQTQEKVGPRAPHPAAGPRQRQAGGTPSQDARVVQIDGSLIVNDALPLAGRSPEAIELKFLIQLTGKPARSPLSRTVQFHGVEPHLDAITLAALRDLAISGEQRQLAVLLAFFIEGFDL